LEEKKIETIDEYILSYSSEIQEILKDLRKFINECAPEATEKISWGMPTFVLHGNLVHFAVNKGYIGFYPADTGVSAFKEELSEYKTTKGSIHLPFNKPIDYDLIRKIVKYRVTENKKIAEEKLNKKGANICLVR